LIEFSHYIQALNTCHFLSECNFSC